MMTFYWLFCISTYLLVWIFSICYDIKAKEFELVKIKKSSKHLNTMSHLIFILFSIIPVINVVVFISAIYSINEINNTNDEEEFIKEYKVWRKK